ncbi:MAG: AMP-dependent synthetase and ligase [Actinoallomurus sp.]|nr:AMP-dependent synthetase and ligase [Actinoallomurus sp.]
MSPDLTLGDTLHENAVRYAEVPAYLADGRVLTHARLRERATAVASALAGTGLRRQERIAVLGRNSIEFGEVLAAGQISGLVVTTVNFRLAPPEIAGILADARPRVLFCDAEYVPVVQALRPGLDGIELVVSFGPADSPGVTAYEDLVASGTPDALPFAARPDDVACLIYTSGTTGRAKGCILGQREMRRLAHVMNVEMRAGCADRVLLSMPMFHIGAMAIGLGLHARGGTAVLHRQFDPAAVLRAVPEDGVSVLHLAPTMLQAMLDQATDPVALAGVRTVVYSAAPITGRTLEAALAAMPDAGFLNLYGQTEVITSGLPRELHRSGGGERDRRRLASVGHPFPDTEVRIVDDEGRDLPPGRPGEIAVRSAAMFRGYWNDHVATATTIRDGWCHTGDVGVFDDEGLLHLVDRKKDVIISGGENVYSREVEEAVLAHPAVTACAVIGVPDERWGEAVCAVIVRAPGAEVSADDVREHVRARLARYKAPRQVILVDDLPLLATGKVDKKRLRARYAGPQ